MHERHGGSFTRIYKIWVGMRARCYQPSHAAYRYYGAKGITVCDAWRTSFVTFRAWAEQAGYRSDKSIDRIDGKRGYSPDNCRWATDKAQARNKGPAANHLVVMHEGKSMNLQQLSAATGVGYTTLNRRYHRGLRGYALWALPQKAADYRRSAAEQTGNGKAKLKHEDVSYIVQSNLSGAELSRRFRVSQATISMIRSGKRRASVT
jgi:hypothetical protein